MLQEGVQFPIRIQLAFRYWLPRILAIEAALKILVSPHIIVTKTFVQEVFDLNRINTAGLEICQYSQEWVNTIKIENI